MKDEMEKAKGVSFLRLKQFAFAKLVAQRILLSLLFYSCSL